MGATLRGAAERSAAASVLIAAEYPIYGRFGYGPASESTAWEIRAPVDSANLSRRVRPSWWTPPSCASSGPTFAELRTQRPGNVERDDLDGIRSRPRSDALARPLAGQLPVRRDATGRPTGYATYHVERAPMAGPTARCTSTTSSPPTRRRQPRLARLLRGGLGPNGAGRRPPVDEVVLYLLVDGRFRQVARDDFMWLRVLDPVAVLGGRRCLAERHGDRGPRRGPASPAAAELDGEGCRRAGGPWT